MRDIGFMGELLLYILRLMVQSDQLCMDFHFPGVIGSSDWGQS